MEPAVEILRELGVSVEVRVLSAHRTPLEMVAFAQVARDQGFQGDRGRCWRGSPSARHGGVSDHAARDRRPGEKPGAFWR